MSTVCAPAVKNCQETERQMPTVLRPGNDFEQIADLSDFLNSVPNQAALVSPDGQTVGIPQEIYRVLVQVVKDLQSGKAVSIMPISTKLTTQQAADFLGISRPTFIKILNRGDIKYERPSNSRHRRVLLSDLLEYSQKLHTQRKEILSEMVADASPEEFSVTADQVRRALSQKRGK